MATNDEACPEVIWRRRCLRGCFSRPDLLGRDDGGFAAASEQLLAGARPFRPHRAGDPGRGLVVSRRGCLGLAAAACVAVAACGGPVYSYRYRLTVEVDTPEGLKSGSSVIETTVQDDSKSWGPIESRLVRPTTKGEAVFVDLGQDRNIIALLAMGANAMDDPDFARLVPSVFGLRGVESLRTIPERKGQFTVPYNLVPTLVTFADLNDPKTARVVRPDELETVFGPGFRFRHALIEITKDTAVRQIEKKLPWLPGFKGYTGGQRDPDWSRPEKNLAAYHFIKGAR
jgi:hypothetical protein